jgi:hypothetical protein
LIAGNASVNEDAAKTASRPLSLERAAVLPGRSEASATAARSTKERLGIA